MNAQRFEDLIAWQKARELSREIYRLTKESPIRRDRALVDQMRRCSVSVMSNLAEGFDRQNSLAEFSHFLSIAKGSCAELRSQLYVALDAEYLDNARFRDLLAASEEVSRVTSGLKSAVEQRRRNA
jgi:four helix bundle protein